MIEENDTGLYSYKPAAVSTVTQKIPPQTNSLSKFAASTLPYPVIIPNKLRIFSLELVHEENSIIGQANRGPHLISLSSIGIKLLAMDLSYLLHAHSSILGAPNQIQQQ